MELIEHPLIYILVVTLFAAIVALAGLLIALWRGQSPIKTVRKFLRSLIENLP